MRDIRICDEQPKHSGGDIRVCDEKSTNSGSDIRACSDDKDDPCKEATAPVVSGDRDCNVGDIYTASGGVPPYAWSFDKGSIDSGGEIISVDSCGASGSSRVGTIRCTDSCGRTGVYKVRLPGGTWVAYATSWTKTCDPTGTARHSVCGTGNAQSTSGIQNWGEKQVSQTFCWVDVRVYGPSCPSSSEPSVKTVVSGLGGCCSAPNDSVCDGVVWPNIIQSLIVSPSTYGDHKRVMKGETIYEWECP